MKDTKHPFGKGRLRLVAAVGLVVSGIAAAQSGSTSEEDRLVEGLLAKMTLEEKFGQLNQPPGPDNNTGPQAEAAGLDQVRKGRVGSYLGVTGAGRTCQYQHVAVEESRLGIPLLFGYDVIHGYRTIFPQSLGEAATFDPAAVEHAARIAAVEASADGVHWTYAPMVDVARDPRWGRISEGSGEDPYLGSVLAAARVRGFQGEKLGEDGTLLATAKHFVAYGAAEAGRDYNIADMSERTLREVYLPPFKAAVDAGVGSVMASFNELNGVPMHANAALIDGVLRKQWGFDGVVVSDYTGIWELTKHGVAADESAAGVLGLKAGVDIDMVSDIYRRFGPKLVRDGRLDEKLVDESVRRVLRAKYRMGLFADPYRFCADTTRAKTRMLTPEHRQAARDVARESLVLLKNDGGVLPLSKDVGKVAVIGPLADSRADMLGNWAGAGRPQDAVTPLQGLREALGEARVLHAKGAGVNGDDESGFDAAVAAAKQADVVLLFIGESGDMSGEASSRSSIDLPGVQQELVEAVKATGKPVVAVVFSGRPLTLQPLHDAVPAIVEAWFPGIEGGHAIADVLFGDYNPAGRLPATFPRNLGQVPIYHAHRNTGRPTRLNPDGKIEKYTSRYLDVDNSPLYPFGHGLSYTTFRYGAPKVKKAKIAAGESQQVEVTVTNTGKREGDEVVQLYLRDDVASVTRPVRELRGFRRVHLKPGESRVLSFELKPDDLAFYDAKLQRVVEPGTFTVFVGGSSEAKLQATFEVKAQ
ncbi:beta-glucosidase BglX [Pseudoxanthomonas sangjuensis]|uniref:glycoside hydrolase family 3 N-terminal domain-containing protein n=1 Tax=Pseudoxanthomonas sangjuensis TaxID=1503750 RepID=UPI001FEC46EB|nr:glycoside hydrolase family 3 N-terminal domain-containing protein [Pseudoxanthomonas sangjuensis]